MLPLSATYQPPLLPPKPGEGPDEISEGLPYLKAPDGLNFVALQITLRR